MSELTTFARLANLWFEGVTRRSQWESFLHGLSATHEFSSSVESKILQGLKKEFPEPKDAQNKCAEVLPSEAIFNTFQKATVAKAICDAANQWEKISFGISHCNPDVLKTIRGLRDKGANMVLLTSGCDVPVVDLHVIRRYNPNADERLVRKIQASTVLYNDHVSRVTEDAQKEGMTPGKYHVAKWLQTVFQEETKAEKFIEDIFGKEKKSKREK